MVKKIPENFLIEVTFKKKNHSLFISIGTHERRHRRSPPLLPTPVLPVFSFFFPVPHSRQDVATGLRTRKRAFPRSGKIYKQRKKFLFPKYKDTPTPARTRSLTKINAQESSFKSIILFFNG